MRHSWLVRELIPMVSQDIRVLIPKWHHRRARQSVGPTQLHLEEYHQHVRAIYTHPGSHRAPHAPWVTRGDNGAIPRPRLPASTTLANQRRVELILDPSTRQCSPRRNPCRRTDRQRAGGKPTRSFTRSTKRIACRSYPPASISSSSPSRIRSRTIRPIRPRTARALRIPGRTKPPGGSTSPSSGTRARRLSRRRSTRVRRRTGAARGMRGR